MITEEARQMVGKDLIKPMTFEIEKSDIKRMAEAMEDPNPLWQDEEYAQKSKYGSIVAPPLFLFTVGFEELQRAELSVPLEATKVLTSALSVEYYEPVKPGDILTLHAKISDLKEVETKLAKMVQVTSDRTFTNQRGQVVGKLVFSIFRY